MKISEFLNDEDIWEEQLDETWKEQERSSIQQSIEAYIHDPKWSQLAMDALQQDTDSKVIEIARFYQLDKHPKS